VSRDLPQIFRMADLTVSAALSTSFLAKSVEKSQWRRERKEIRVRKSKYQG
jgi:post-segregation antitoxin (ccd killing protein)